MTTIRESYRHLPAIYAIETTVGYCRAIERVWVYHRSCEYVWSPSTKTHAIWAWCSYKCCLAPDFSSMESRDAYNALRLLCGLRITYIIISGISVSWFDGLQPSTLMLPSMHLKTFAFLPKQCQKSVSLRSESPFALRFAQRIPLAPTCFGILSACHLSLRACPRIFPCENGSSLFACLVILEHNWRSDRCRAGTELLPQGWRGHSVSRNSHWVWVVSRHPPR